MTKKPLLHISSDARTTTLAALKNSYWMHERQAGKLSRLSFTDALQAFFDYTDPNQQKSTTPTLSAFIERNTSLMYRTLKIDRRHISARLRGVPDEIIRDSFDVAELNRVRECEAFGSEIIMGGIHQQQPRKEIKQGLHDFWKMQAKSLQDLRTWGGSRLRSSV